VVSTGDELHDAPQDRGPGGQYDGNRPMLLASLASAGYQAIDLGIVADHADALAETLNAAAQMQLDAVVSSGGVAQGDADIVRRFPGLEFIPLAIRPGRGIAFGRLTSGGHSLWLFGLPGNSVAAYVMFRIVVAPLLAMLAGTTLETPLSLQLPLAVDASTRAGHVDWRRGRFVHRYGGLAVEPMAQQGSFMLRTLSEADVLIAIGPQAEVHAGEQVDVIPLTAFA
jgi:molybdopterin molybdotransferase